MGKRALLLLGVAMAKNQNPNSASSHDVLVKGRQIAYGISNSRGSGHSPPYKV
jgi:hypothetical protein